MLRLNEKRHGGNCSSPTPILSVPRIAPSQITFYGLTGGPERWLKIPLDLSQPPVTYALQAHDFVAKTPFVPYHGRTTGFIVNYTPDSVVRFDRDGNPVEHVHRAYIPGQVEVFIGKKKLPASGLFGN